MTDHPSAEELLDLVRGRLAPRRGGEILRHLHAGCESCLAAAPSGLVAGLGVPREPTTKEEAATAAAINRAFSIALREERSLRRRQAQRERVIKVLMEGRVKGPQNLPRSMKQVDKVEALLAASWAIRFEDVGMMVYFAQLAVSCAEQLDTHKYGEKEVLDLQSRALAELGNAYRASDQFDKAGASLERARQLFELGSRADSLEIRLLSLEASFDSDCRRFRDACWRLKKVLRYYQRNEMDHLAGRTLLQLGRFTSFSGSYREALDLIDESLSLLDKNQDPGLIYIAKQNRVEVLIWLRQYKDAELQLFQLRGMQSHSDGPINELRLRWLAGRIEAGKNRLDRAEESLREVHEGWVEFGRGYNSALASLELSAVLLAQRKADQATVAVALAYKILLALNIQREALVAVLVLRTACELKEATREQVERVTRYLMKLEHDPHAELEE